MRIFVVGYMLAGKSSFGRRLAKRLKYRFVDTDKLIEWTYKLSVDDIFEKYGEEVFRLLEKRILNQTLSMDNVVIATGGGLPCHDDNMNIIRQNGISIYLKASPKAIISRNNDSHKPRPLLKNLKAEELEEFITNHLDSREKFYSQADFSFNALDLNLEEIVRIIS